MFQQFLVLSHLRFLWLPYVLFVNLMPQSSIAQYVMLYSAPARQLVILIKLLLFLFIIPCCYEILLWQIRMKVRIIIRVLIMELLIMLKISHFLLLKNRQFCIMRDHRSQVANIFLILVITDFRNLSNFCCFLETVCEPVSLENSSQSMSSVRVSGTNDPFLNPNAYSIQTISSKKRPSNKG